MAGPRPFVGLLAGIAAGLVASAAMAVFQAQTQKLLPDPGEDDPATVKAADVASEAVIGDPVPEPYREPAGQMVHYVAGAVIGGIYGVLTEYRPEARSGFGGDAGSSTSGSSRVRAECLSRPGVTNSSVCVAISTPT